MLTVTVNDSNPPTISFPKDELEKLGMRDGDEIEISKNERNEIVLRPKSNKRVEKILDATREIIERRRPALIELGKGHQ